MKIERVKDEGVSITVRSIPSGTVFDANKIGGLFRAGPFLRIDRGYVNLQNNCVDICDGLTVYGYVPLKAKLVIE
jgi:hypothetical protein